MYVMFFICPRISRLLAASVLWLVFLNGSSLINTGCLIAHVVDFVGLQNHLRLGNCLKGRQFQWGVVVQDLQIHPLLKRGTSCNYQVIVQMTIWENERKLQSACMVTCSSPSRNIHNLEVLGEKYQSQTRLDILCWHLVHS